MKKRTPSTGGFTLIELVICVAIVGTLVAIAIPKFGEMMSKSKEGTTQGNLGALRSALSIYYADTEGQYPSDGTGPTRHGNKHRACTTCTTNLDPLLDGNYITDIPDANLPGTEYSTGHDSADTVDAITINNRGDLLVTDIGGWAYQWDRSKTYWGTVVVNCNHQDVKGRIWTSY